MSDTPETDSESFEYDQQCSPVVDAEFAARLERERDEARRISQDWERWIKEVLTDFRIPHDAHTEQRAMALIEAVDYWKDAK
jgi:hypothetical protein